MFAAVQLPNAASLQRTDELARKVEKIAMDTPGVKYVSSVVGFSLLSGVQNTYSAFFFITLKEWKERKAAEEPAHVIWVLDTAAGGAVVAPPAAYVMAL